MSLVGSLFRLKSYGLCLLSRLKPTKKPQRKFVTHLLGLMLMLPGHATFRNMSRYSLYHERTFAR